MMSCCFLIMIPLSSTILSRYISGAWFLSRDRPAAVVDIKGANLINGLARQAGFASAFVKTLKIVNISKITVYGLWHFTGV